MDRRADWEVERSACQVRQHGRLPALCSCLPIHTFSVALGVLILEKAEEIRGQMIDLVL